MATAATAAAAAPAFAFKPSLSRRVFVTLPRRAGRVPQLLR